jgi:hypothetical protein
LKTEFTGQSPQTAAPIPENLPGAHCVHWLPPGPKNPALQLQNVLPSSEVVSPEHDWHEPPFAPK